MELQQMISKEEVNGLQFPIEDVLLGRNAQINRKLSLERALVLGNLERTKVRIIFEDIEKIKLVETTIWGLTDKDIILKRGVVIPIRRIMSVEII